MSELFLKIVNMSISASWVVVAVLALRFGILHGKLYELQLGKLNLGGQ